ncbi:hypothetical protein [Pedobacter sp. MC2016-24]|uniref:hypothetical protein n=1 Tax=Pedobacter sp. MC2016-24 TaxID=2780090 RepID=UPI00187F1B8C|nr:hypothetical protein [Pedobacter sp. MC2016-24]MBE9599936.1 hypothetical protein [Pedobacter sp. MC2016-24]
MNQFRIEVASNGQEHTYNITRLGNHVFDIYQDEDKIGTIELDDQNHEHCLTSDCELDLPLLNAIREAIHAHESPDSAIK